MGVPAPLSVWLTASFPTATDPEVSAELEKFSLPISVENALLVSSLGKVPPTPLIPRVRYEGYAQSILEENPQFKYIVAGFASMANVCIPLVISGLNVVPPIPPSASLATMLPPMLLPIFKRGMNQAMLADEQTPIPSPLEDPFLMVFTTYFWNSFPG